MKKIFRYGLVAALLWYAVGLPDLMQTWRDAHVISLQVKLRSSVPSFAQVFYDVGRGLLEEDSVHRITTANETATYNFPLPTATVRAFRFDPATTAGTVTVETAIIADANGKPLHEFAPADFVAMNQIKSVRRTPEDGVEIVTDDLAPDPSLTLKLAAPLQLAGEHEAAHAWVTVVGWHTLAALVMLAIVYALVRLFRAVWGRGWLNFSLPPGEEVEWIPAALYLYMASVFAVVAVSVLCLERLLFKTVL